MKLSDIDINITFTDDGKPVVSLKVTFDTVQQMNEYLDVIKGVVEKELTEKQSKEVIDGLNKARGKGD